LAIMAVALAACATPPKYGPMADNHGLGYRDTHNPDGSYTILVVAYTAATAQEFWDRRAQELCGSADFHKNIFRAEVPVVRVSGYATNAYNPSYGASYTEDQHGNFYLEGYLRCDAEAPAQEQAREPNAAPMENPPAVTP
jgi:hypothetical protein